MAGIIVYLVVFSIYFTFWLIKYNVFGSVKICNF